MFLKSLLLHQLKMEPLEILRFSILLQGDGNITPLFQHTYRYLKPDMLPGAAFSFLISLTRKNGTLTSFCETQHDQTESLPISKTHARFRFCQLENMKCSLNLDSPVSTARIRGSIQTHKLINAFVPY